MRPDALSGQSILVTGAATGIGRACARYLAAAGARVWINHLNQHALAEELVAQIHRDGGQAELIESDVASVDAVASMFERINSEGPLDALVNNAGLILEQPFLQTTEETWRRIMAVDLDGVYRCCRHALKDMVEAGRGSIVNVASDLGFLGREDYVAYCTAKAGVIGLTRSLAREFGPAIQINGVAPGPIETAMVSLEHMSEEWIARELAIPAARLGQPEEVAAAVGFLLSSEASFFTGQILGPNGGSWMGG